MAIKRTKRGNVTTTINTRTGRKTTSITHKAGAHRITWSQSNQGHNRSTQTTNLGNGWFDRKTTNWNKKSRRKKSSINWSWLFSGSSSRKKNSPREKTSGAVAGNMPDIKAREVPEIKKEPQPWFWEIKKFKEFDMADWFLYIFALPFRVIYWIVIFNIWCIIIYLVFKFLWWIIFG